MRAFAIGWHLTTSLRLLAFVFIVLALISPGVFVPKVSAVGPVWPTLQHDVQHTGRSSATGPNTADVKWRFDISDSDGGIYGGPSIASDGTIYLAVGNNNGGSLYALDPSRCPKWKFNLAANSASVPTIDPDGTVYVGLSAGGFNRQFYAVNPDGTLKWIYTLPRETSASPVVGDDGTIYIVTENGEVHAINNDGSRKWVYTMGSQSRSTGAIAPDGTIYVGSEEGGLFALNPDGSLKWRFTPATLPGTVTDFRESSAAVGVDGTIYVGTGQGTFFAVTPVGAELWRYTPSPRFTIRTTPAIASDGTIYFGNYGGGTGQGAFIALNPDGTLRWSFFADRIQSPPVIGADGVIYFGTVDTLTFYAFNPDGTLLWSYVTGSIVGSTAIGADGTLYVGATRFVGNTRPDALYAFGLPGGAATNCAPLTTSDSYSTNKNMPLTVAAPGVLGNDSDVDGDSLAAVPVNGPSHGTLTLNANGSFTYTPDTNYTGPDSFTYKANDGQADSNVATVTLTINRVNNPPSAANDSYTTDEDTPLTVPTPGVLANDTDVDGDSLIAVLVSGPTHGALTLNADGSFTYTPAANYNGLDSFTYKAKDTSNALSNAATVNLTVNAVNDLPVAGNDTATTPKNTSVTIPVLDNDSDVDGDTLTVTNVPTNSSQGGTVTTNGTTVTYRPKNGFRGVDSFTYTIGDGHGGTATTTVTVTVTK